VQFKNIREILLASVDYEAGLECLIAGVSKFFIIGGTAEVCKLKYSIKKLGEKIQALWSSLLVKSEL
jgi:hypothetical protein